MLRPSFRPVPSTRQFAFVLATLLATLSLTTPTSAQTPVPAIDIISTAGQAPFAVHVHGLNSSVGTGDEMTARYEWDFGDPAGQHNTLAAWNAAHIYDQPGTYTIRLKVINANGVAATTTRQVVVTSTARTTIYVSPTGNDANSGLTPQMPIRTIARAAQLVGPNKAILFQRGGFFDTTSTITISATNVLLGAYGSGANPVLNFTSTQAYAKLIGVNDSARDVVIENLAFDSPFIPNKDIVRGIGPHGTNVTIRNCQFGKLSYAINTEGGGPHGLLALNNTAGTLGAYFAWVEGSDHAYIGNVAGMSVEEHNIRLGGAARVLIARNDLTNTGKSCVWCMLGDHASVIGNTLREGRFIVGPNFAASSPSERFRRVVFEGNQMINDGVVIYHGAEDIAIRNNIIDFDNGDIFSIWGYDGTYNRTARNIAICNNTAINESASYGRFVRIGVDDEGITVMDNLYVAPALNGHSGGNVVSEDGDLNNHVFRNNLWAIPDVGPRYHVVNSSALNPAQWDSYPQTQNELYRAFSTGDLNASFAPTFNTGAATPAAGVLVDYYGNARPVAGVTIGAVQVGGSSPPPPPPPSGGSPDVNGDGAVNVNDMLILVGSWGTCPGGSCTADINADGVVNVNDLLIMIGAWD